MSRVLPILFNTDMVRAILDGRKTVTRRGIKFPEGQTGHLLESGKRDYIYYPGGIKYPPYQPGDILYVRETWCRGSLDYKKEQYYYKADNIDFSCKWHPSIHMPKEAARIWLKVTDVWVERLQDIAEEQAQAEGCNSGMLTGPCTARGQFENLWNSTLKKSDLDRYGWDANPWVWVIEFQQCEKPELLKRGGAE